MKRKVIALSLIAVMALQITACGVKGEVDNNSKAETDVVETKETASEEDVTSTVSKSSDMDKETDTSVESENTKKSDDSSSSKNESKKNSSSEKVSSKNSDNKKADSSKSADSQNNDNSKSTVITTIIDGEEEDDNNNDNNNDSPAEEPTVSYYDPVESEELKEPEVSEPVVEVPVVSEPVVSEPDIDEPVVDEPVIEDPVESEVVIDSPYARPFDLEAIRNDMIQQGLDAGMNLNEELTIEGTSWMFPLDTNYYNGTTEESVNYFMRDCEYAVNAVIDNIYYWGDTPDLYDFNIVILDSPDFEGEFEIYVVYG